MAHCPASDDASKFSIREYLKKHYGMNTGYADALMDTEAVEVETGIRFRSNAGYVGDKIVRDLDLIERNCAICNGDEDDD